MEREQAIEALALLERVVRQTRDDTALQNWGAIWILHGISNGLGFVIMQIMIWSGVPTCIPYALLWVVIQTGNVIIIFRLKKQRAGVRSFVENHLWVIWSTFIVAVIFVGFINYLLALPIFALGPVIAVLAAFSLTSMGALMGMRYYITALLFGLIGLLMAAVPRWQFIILGIAWAALQITGGVMLNRDRERSTGGPQPAAIV